MRHQYEEAQLKLEEARSEFITIGSRLGAAQCLQSLGNILKMQDQYEEAQLKLEEAQGCPRVQVFAGDSQKSPVGNKSESDLDLFPTDPGQIRSNHR